MVDDEKLKEYADETGRLSAGDVGDQREAIRRRQNLVGLVSLGLLSVERFFALLETAVSGDHTETGSE